MNKKTYDNTSIKSLKGPDKIRKRPGVMLGSDDVTGTEHTFFEILSNSIDEAKDGHGNVIEVTIHKDSSITVKDYGRGIPLEFNEAEGQFNWQLVFCELYAGGKYDEDNYEYSLGLNGLGACATQFSSEFFDVEVIRDGYKYNLHFEKGYNIGGLKKTKLKPKEMSSLSTGTTQHWKPDLEVFTDIDIPNEYFEQVLETQAMVNAGIKFIYTNERTNTKKEYYYQGGLVEYVTNLLQDSKTMLTEPYSFNGNGIGRDREDKQDYKVKAEVIFAFDNNINLIQYYHNSSFLEHGGAPDKAAKKAFIFVIDKIIKQKGKYNKNESKISFDDISDSLVLIINSFSTETSYENQTKKAINNKFIELFITNLIKEQLEVWFLEHEFDGNKIIDQVLANKRSREKADEQRQILKKKLSGSNDSWDRVKKFVDCKSKDPAKRELFIVEGDSALGAVKMGRDAEFQAIMPIRGKILNCLKADINSILKSDIIMDLMRVIGCGIEIPLKHAKKGIMTFNIDNLKFHKICITTDADVDGFQIRTLVATMIYRLCPTLINEGYVYIAETPLFEIVYKQGREEKLFYAFDDSEKNNFVKTHKNIIKINRSKGLGENDAEFMWETTMNPENRRLIKLVPDDVEKMQETFELFLGNNVQNRRDYIEENGNKYLEYLDVVD